MVTIRQILKNGLTFCGATGIGCLIVSRALGSRFALYEALGFFAGFLLALGLFILLRKNPIIDKGLVSYKVRNRIQIIILFLGILTFIYVLTRGT